MADKARVVLRHLILLLCFWLPATRRKKIERWLRGREEFKKLQRCDWVLMSWGKSGRTWLRVMMSRAYTLKGGIDASELLDFDNLKGMDASLPAVFFTHNNYIKDYTGNFASKRHFQGKRIVLLVRDPRDVAVSQFFQWQYRMRPNKKFINDYPPHGADIDAWQFVQDKDAGCAAHCRLFQRLGPGCSRAEGRVDCALRGHACRAGQSAGRRSWNLPARTSARSRSRRRLILPPTRT